MSGPRSSWVVVGAVVVGFAALLVGCAQIGPVTDTTVADVKSVAGTWKGVVHRSGFEPDYVTMTIRDDGSFDVKSVQGNASSTGQGKVVIRDGRLLLEGAKGGHAVATLAKSPAGDVVMTIDGTLSDNSTLTAKLFPAR
jgi:hypothetical protein